MVALGRLHPCGDGENGSVLEADLRDSGRSVYTHVVSEDARRIAGQLGEAVWGGILASNQPLDKKNGA